MRKTLVAVDVALKNQTKRRRQFSPRRQNNDGVNANFAGQKS
jgi:hypothetical protein